MRKSCWVHDSKTVDEGAGSKVKLAAVNIKMISDNQLLRNLDKLHTTKLGRIRIEHNLSLTNRDVIAFCKEKILNPEAIMTRKGKIGTSRLITSS